MPESYEALIEIYKDKQKDLNIEIMEDPQEALVRCWVKAEEFL